MAGLLTTREVAQILNLTREYVGQLCKEGKIPATKIFNYQWRIKRADIVRLVEEGKNREGET